MTYTIATAQRGAGPWVWHHRTRLELSRWRLAILAVQHTAPQAPNYAEEQALVRRALLDPNAFETIYRTHVRDVRLFIYKRCGSIELADDITAATFEKALRNLKRFESKRGGMRSWLLVIAGNTLTDHYRRSSSERARLHRAQHDPNLQRWVGIDTADHDNQEREVQTQAQLTMVRTALEHIHPRYREAIALRFLDGMDNSTAAAATGRTGAAMSVLTHRAIRALTHQLKNEAKL